MHEEGHAQREHNQYLDSAEDGRRASREADAEVGENPHDNGGGDREDPHCRFTTNSRAFQLHFSYMLHTTEKADRAPVSKKRRLHMHDIEQKPSQDDSTIKMTDLPRQEDQQMAPGAGATPVTSKPKYLRQPFAMRTLAAGESSCWCSP